MCVIICYKLSLEEDQSITIPAVADKYVHTNYKGFFMAQCYFWIRLHYLVLCICMHIHISF